MRNYNTAPTYGSHVHGHRPVRPGHFDDTLVLYGLGDHGMNIASRGRRDLSHGPVLVRTLVELPLSFCLKKHLL